MKKSERLLKVYFNPDGSCTLKWDPTDPDASYFNGWSKEDFINAIMTIVQDSKKK